MKTALGNQENAFAKWKPNESSMDEVLFNLGFDEVG